MRTVRREGDKVHVILEYPDHTNPLISLAEAVLVGIEYGKQEVEKIEKMKGGVLRAFASHVSLFVSWIA